MHPFVRLLASVLMGLIVAFAISFGIEFLNSQMYPLPPGTDYRDRCEVLTGVSLRACPVCPEGQMRVIEHLVGPRPTFSDTS